MKSALLCSLLALGLTASQANASILLNTTSSDPTSSGDTQMATWLSGLVTSYNTSNDPDLPAPGAQVFRVNKNAALPSGAPSGFPTYPDDTLEISLPTSGFNYVVLHWGGEQGNAFYAYFIGDESGTTKFLAPGDNGLSSYSLFGTRTTTVVPEPSTYIAGGLALVPLLLGLRSRLAKKA